MSARLLDGHAAAAAIRQAVLPDVHAFTAAPAGRQASASCWSATIPRLRSTSATKCEPAAESGLWVDLQRLPATASLDDLLGLVARLNASPVHDGILVQAPLPEGMGQHAAQRVFDAIDPAKDVDGFHPVNVGRLVQGRPHLVPCTPSGVIEMLEQQAIRDRRHGRGRDRPQRNRRQADGDAAAATRRDGDDLSFEDARICRGVAAAADILVAAIGRAGFVTPEFVKPGATVIDVGINRVTDAVVARSLFDAGLAAARGFRAARFDRRRRRAPEVAECRRAP